MGRVQQRVKHVILLSLASLVGLYACNFHEDKDAGKKNPTSLTGKPQAQSDFVWLSEKIFEAKCLGCHGTDGRGGVNLNSFESITQGRSKSGPLVVPGQAEQSRLYQAIASGAMPPRGSKVAAEELAVLALWINKGAQQTSIDRPMPKEGDGKGEVNKPGTGGEKPPVNPPTPPVTPPHTAMSFKAIFDEVISKNNCLTCHSSATEGNAFTDLSSYEAVMNKPSLVEKDNINNLYNVMVVDPGTGSSYMPMSMSPDTPASPVPEAQQAMVKQWIEDGAKP